MLQLPIQAFYSRKRCYGFNVIFSHFFWLYWLKHFHCGNPSKTMLGNHLYLGGITALALYYSVFLTFVHILIYFTENGYTIPIIFILEDWTHCIQTTDTLEWCHTERDWAFIQTFVQPRIKENIKVPGHWPLWGNSPVTGEFPTHRASNIEIVSIWWHHDMQLSFRQTKWDMRLPFFFFNMQPYVLPFRPHSTQTVNSTTMTCIVYHDVNKPPLEISLLAFNLR